LDLPYLRSRPCAIRLPAKASPKSLITDRLAVLSAAVDLDRFEDLAKGVLVITNLATGKDSESPAGMLMGDSSLSGRDRLPQPDALRRRSNCFRISWTDFDSRARNLARGTGS
jgi:hypothetical protein